MRQFAATVIAGLVAVLSAVAVDSHGIHADLTYASKYMAHGFNISDDEPTWQPSVAVDALTPGLQFCVWTAFAADRDWRVNDELDYMVKYNRTVLAKTRWEMNLHGYADYWIYPHSPEPTTQDLAAGRTFEDKKGIKLHGGVSFNRAIPLGPVFLSPSYNFYHWAPEKSGAFQSGGAHELCLDYTLPTPAVMPYTKNQFIRLGTGINYHTGAFGVESGWSHATAHLSTPVEIATCVLTPSINYQWSFEDTVNPENDFWATLSLSKSF